MKSLHLVLCSWIFSSVSWLIVYGNLSRICKLLFYENCINFNYVKLVHIAFQVYYILLLLCTFILLIFESLILKLQLKILIYVFKEPLDESERGEWKSWLKAQHLENKDHGIWSHHFMASRCENNGNSGRFYWGAGAPKSLQMLTASMKLKDAYSLEEKLWPT